MKDNKTKSAWRPQCPIKLYRQQTVTSLTFRKFSNNNIIKTAIIRPATVRMPQLAICEENFLPLEIEKHPQTAGYQTKFV